MGYPKLIYAIYPKKQNGDIAGVYVGSTSHLNVRITGHLRSQSPEQSEFHKLMNENGYSVQILGQILDRDEAHLEFDWIDFFDKLTDLHVFNIDRWLKQSFRNCFIQCERLGDPFFDGHAIMFRKLSEETKRLINVQYPILREEMAGRRMSIASLAKIIEMSQWELKSILKGEKELKLSTAIKIWKAIDEEIGIDDLFDTAEE